MSRYKITIQYEGTKFFGWQMQSAERTVKGEIEGAIAPLNNNDRVKIIGAGRTDTGVHALGQVAHFDLDTNLDISNLLNALNARLSEDVRILNIEKVNDDFHARFSAKKRYYQYQCYTGTNLLYRNQAWLIDEIKIKTLDSLAKLIIDEHDFLSFSKLNKELEHTRCIIYESGWKMTKEMLIFNVCGNRFLHHMVRYLVGTMIAVVQNRIPFENFKELLINPQTNVKIFKAPAQGLFLKGIDYE